MDNIAHKRIKKYLECTPPVTLHLKSKITLTLPAHDLLSKVFEDFSRQYSGEYTPQLLNSINLENLDSPFIYLFTKPNGFGGIVFALQIKLWW